MSIQGIRAFLYVVIGVLAYLLMSNILDFTVKDLLDTVRKLCTKLLHGSSRRLEKRNAKVFRTQSVKERKKSLIYKFFKLVNQMIVDLGIKDITSEYLVMCVLLSSTGLSVVLCFFGLNVVSGVLLIVCIFSTFFCFMYLLSRSQNRKRREAIRNAEDIICQNIKPSVLQTIKEVMPKIDPILKPEFERFVIDEKSIYIENALINLNENIGPEFDNLVGKLIKLDKEGKPGMLDAFKSNITRNSIQREYEIAEKEKEDADTQEFFLCLGVVLATFVFTFFGFKDVRSFYMSVPGQIIILVCLLTILGIFCYCQYIQNKRYE